VSFLHHQETRVVAVSSGLFLSLSLFTRREKHTLTRAEEEDLSSFPPQNFLLLDSIRFPTRAHTTTL
jgi:hypothetical protein